jgi:hypothetical protein
MINMDDYMEMIGNVMNMEIMENVMYEYRKIGNDYCTY